MQRRTKKRFLHLCLKNSSDFLHYVFDFKTKQKTNKRECVRIPANKNLFTFKKNSWLVWGNTYFFVWGLSDNALATHAFRE